MAGQAGPQPMCLYAREGVVVVLLYCVVALCCVCIRVVLSCCVTRLHACQDSEGCRVWSAMAPSGFCLMAGPQCKKIESCKFCRRKSTQAAWPREGGRECMMCLSMCKLAFKDVATRAAKKKELADKLQDDTEFEEWKNERWLPYKQHYSEGKVPSTCLYY